MNFWTFASRSLTHYYRSHFGVLMGVMIGATILTGALMVGDCVKATLEHEALLRLGDTKYALYHPTRFIREELAASVGESLESEVIPALNILGVASSNQTNLQANQVNVYGVNSNFWPLGEDPLDSFDDESEGVWINQQLADHLQVEIGDTLILRMEKPSLLSRDAPLSTFEDAQAVLRQEIAGIVDEQRMGRFDLRSNQTAPFLVYLPLSQLQDVLDHEGRINLMIIPKEDEQVPLAMIHKALEHHWRLEDAQLELRSYDDSSMFELRSERVFLDQTIQQVVKTAFTQEDQALEGDYNLAGVLTYLVNELRTNENSVPYSTVASIGELQGSFSNFEPLEGLKDNEIVINQWLADHLEAEPGDSLEMKYYVFGVMRKLEEMSETFRIKSIIPMDHPLNDRALMPDYPGIQGRENCRDWDPGFTVDLDAIRPADEDYWDEYRGTPKAYISLTKGQPLWSNRFGNLTAVRFISAQQEEAAQAQETIRTVLHSAFTPYMFGFSFQDVREQALQAVQQSMDFGPLFIGFSFFLIVASLILVSLLFLFSIEQRNAQTGLLMAIGFTHKKIQRFYLLEGLLLACIGALPGCLLAMAYNGFLLWGLSTIWSGAVSQIDFQFVVNPQTLVIGFVSSIMMAIFAIWFGLRKAFHRPIRELLTYSAGYNASQRIITPMISSKGLWICVLSIVLCFVMSMIPAETSVAEAGKFFGIGTFMLIGLIGFCHFLIGRLAQHTQHARLSLVSFGLRNNSRRVSRSLAIIGMLACGSFLIVSIGANMRDPFADAEQRSSGTGGFEYFGETTMPIFHDLNTDEGLAEYGLSKEDVPGVTIIPIRVRHGDEASCLNMNRAQTPRLLGVDSDTLAEIEPFTFIDAKEELDQEGWALLKARLTQEDVPTIADQATIMWALGQSLGERIAYTSEQGEMFYAQLVGALNNTILQGSLIIDEEVFLERFPSIGGYQYFLIEAPREQEEEIAETLTYALQDVGLQLTPTTERLAAFYRVENTYLSIFQILGGLGLILGCAGIGVIVMRNVMERRGELALLRAVGFSKESIGWMILIEHWLLLVLGLGIGILAGVIAVLPHILGQNTQLPYFSLVVTIVAMLLFGILWIGLAGKIALRGSLLEALQNE